MSDQECLLGEVIDGEMRLSAWRRIVQKCWEAVPDHFPNVELDVFCDAESCAWNLDDPAASREINTARSQPGARVWQRNYWEHVIRDEASMDSILRYLETNPDRWAEDCFFRGSPE